MYESDVYSQIFPYFNLEEFNEENYLQFENNELDYKINDNDTEYISKEKEKVNEKALNEENYLKDDSRNSEINNNDEKKLKKKSGRKKTKNKDNKIEHNKYSCDNLLRKCKHLVIKSLKEFLNEQIISKYNGNIGCGVFRKEFQTFKQSQKSNAKIIYNQMFIHKTIGEIFSENVSARITNLPKNHNKLLINTLINEKDEGIKNYFNKIFNLKFIECVDHFIGTTHIEILNGLKCFEDIKEKIIKKYKDGEEYCKNLDLYLKKYKEIILSKRGRNSRKRIINNKS